jgi:uncharacterized membrane protein
VDLLLLKERGQPDQGSNVVQEQNGFNFFLFLIIIIILFIYLFAVLGIKSRALGKASLSHSAIPAA